MAHPATELTRLYAGVMARLSAALRATQGGLTPASRSFVQRQLRGLARDMTRIEALEAELVRALGPEFLRSSAQANSTLRAAGWQLTNAAQTELEVQTLRQLETRLSRDLRAVRLALSEALVLNDPVTRGPKAVEAALREDGLVSYRDGQARVQTPSGKYWRADRYATMLTRTAVADARREAFRTRYLANGVDVVYVVPNGTDHAVCAAWEGRLLSLTGATPGLPTVDDARSAGLFHPQCRHRYVTATPDRLRDAGLRVAPLPTVSLREGLNDVQPTAPRPTLGRAAPGVPGRTSVPLGTRRV